MASRELHELLAERSKMREELTLWRAMYGTAGPADSAKSIVGVGPGFAELLRVEEETLGTFPHGFGENGSEEEHAGGARQGSNDSIGQSSQGRRASNEDETSAPATSLPPYPPAITTTGRHMVQRVQQVQQSGPHGPMQGANQRPPVEWGYGMSHGQQHGLMLESPLTATSEFDTLLDMLQYPTSAVSDTVDADVWSINGIARATTSAVLPPAYYTSDSEHAFASAALSR